MLLQETDSKQTQQGSHPVRQDSKGWARAWGSLGGRRPVGSIEKVLKDGGREPCGASWRKIPGRAQHGEQEDSGAGVREREEEEGDGRAVPSSLGSKGPAQRRARPAANGRPNNLRRWGAGGGRGAGGGQWRWPEVAAPQDTSTAAPVFVRGWVWASAEPRMPGSSA